MELLYRSEELMSESLDTSKVGYIVLTETAENIEDARTYGSAILKQLDAHLPVHDADSNYVKGMIVRTIARTLKNIVRDIEGTLHNVKLLVSNTVDVYEEMRDEGEAIEFYFKVKVTTY